MGIRNTLARLLGVSRASKSPEPRPSHEALLAGALAEEIVNDYGKALEIGAKFPLGAPESLLSRSRETVAAAIVAYTKCLHSAEKLESQAYDQLCIAYSELAHFIPDHDAQEGMIAWAALSSHDPSDVTVDTSRAMERHRGILDEKSRRLREFSSIMEGAGVSLC